MAIGATIYKIQVNLSNFNTHYYQDLNLTMAKHPSENEARMMFRLLTYLYNAHEDLEFSKGLSTTEEPELWQKNYTGEIVQWIELGLPDGKRIRQACGKSKLVKIFTYHPNKAAEWFEKIKKEIVENKKLKIFHFQVFSDGPEGGPIDKFVTKNMKLSCIIEDQLMYLGNDEQRIGVKVIAAN